MKVYIPAVGDSGYPEYVREWDMFWDMAELTAWPMGGVYTDKDKALEKLKEMVYAELYDKTDPDEDREEPDLSQWIIEEEAQAIYLLPPNHNQVRDWMDVTMVAGIIGINEVKE